jgi:hypothetical protein
MLSVRAIVVHFGPLVSTRGMDSDELVDRRRSFAQLGSTVVHTQSCAMSLKLARSALPAIRHSTRASLHPRR